MRTYRLDRVSDAELLRALASLVSQDRSTTAALVAHVAEVDARKLYLPAGYASMYAYCLGELRLSEDAASKRIQAARVARDFPQCLEALADGRIHLTGLCVLAPHLSTENVDDLLAAATHKTKFEIEQLNAAAHPKSESLPLVCAAASPCTQHAPAHVPGVAASRVAPPQQRQAHVVKPIAQERFVLQLSMSKATHDKLEQLRSLLSHAIPGGDLAEVLDYALTTTIAQVEKRRYGAPKSRKARGSADPGRVPAQVRRAVWYRDHGQCAFVADDGHRCEARDHLEFDHIEPIARGGTSTVDNLRLHCRAHNQFQAERIFGGGFMAAKRAAAQTSAERERLFDCVAAALRGLGYRRERAQHAAAQSSAPGLTLEQHVKAALRITCAIRGGRREAPASA